MIDAYDSFALLDVPDPACRLEKSRWLQLRHLITDALTGDQISEQPRASLALHGGEHRLARAVGCSLGRPVTALQSTVPSEPSAHRHSAAVLVIPDDRSPSQRLDLIRGVLGRLRYGGVLVVIANVVRAPDNLESTTPSTSQLIEELSLAGGGTLYEERVSSVRWTGDDFVRGICLTMRYHGSGGVGA